MAQRLFLEFPMQYFRAVADSGSPETVKHNTEFPLSLGGRGEALTPGRAGGGGGES